MWHGVAAIRHVSPAQCGSTAIDALAAGPTRANLFTALGRVTEVEGRHAAATLYLITDNQSNTWREVCA